MTNRTYVGVEEAVDMSGLRIAISAHVPGAWGEAARAMFDSKRIPYFPVIQTPGGFCQVVRRRPDLSSK